LPERAGRLRALRVGFEGLGLQAQPSRIARLPSARRTASRAEGARCKAERHAPEAASPLRRSSDPRDRRQPGPAITHLLSAPRAAKPKTTTKKQHRSAPPPRPARPPTPIRRLPYPPHRPPRPIPHQPTNPFVTAPALNNTDVNNPSIIRTPIAIHVIRTISQARYLSTLYVHP